MLMISGDSLRFADRARFSSDARCTRKGTLIMLRKFMNDEAGFIICAELVLCFTIIFCGCAVGLAVVRDALVQELGDVTESIGALDQSYNFRSVTAELEAGGGANHASCAGSGFNDEEDDCDCKGIILGSVGGKNDPSTLNNAESTNN
jgi:hypothetical protein